MSREVDRRLWLRGAHLALHTGKRRYELAVDLRRTIVSETLRYVPLYPPVWVLIYRSGYQAALLLEHRGYYLYRWVEEHPDVGGVLESEDRLYGREIDLLRDPQGKRIDVPYVLGVLKDERSVRIETYGDYIPDVLVCLSPDLRKSLGAVECELLVIGDFYVHVHVESLLQPSGKQEREQMTYVHLVRWTSSGVQEKVTSPFVVS